MGGHPADGVLPVRVYLAYVFYATSIPRDLLAAGRVDGCSEWQLFRFICLPISRTLIGLLAFLSFTANWNNYFLPFVMLNDDHSYTLAVGLQSLVTGTRWSPPPRSAARARCSRARRARSWAC